MLTLTLWVCLLGWVLILPNYSELGPQSRREWLLAAVTTFWCASGLIEHASGNVIGAQILILAIVPLACVFLIFNFIDFPEVRAEIYFLLASFAIVAWHFHPTLGFPLRSILFILVLLILLSSHSRRESSMPLALAGLIMSTDALRS